MALSDQANAAQMLLAMNRNARQQPMDTLLAPGDEATEDRPFVSVTQEVELSGAVIYRVNIFGRTGTEVHVVMHTCSLRQDINLNGPDAEHVRWGSFLRILYRSGEQNDGIFVEWYFARVIEITSRDDNLVVLAFPGASHTDTKRLDPTQRGGDWDFYNDNDFRLVDNPYGVDRSALRGTYRRPVSKAQQEPDVFGTQPLFSERQIKFLPETGGVQADLRAKVRLR